MFFDQAKIYIRSGNGGDGMISFRREKHVPYGGPDGGDGGDGGDIIFAGNRHLNSLMRFNRQAHFKAEHGTHGSKQNRSGKRGETLRIEVPSGTVIRDAETGAVLADITSEDQEITVLQGGKGGRGNSHFASSVNQAPRIAERGEPGAELWVTLELKLIADVGIVGVPNAGKSTLLSVISGASPKIANYPFTTLQPNLGVVELDDFETFVVADIPGLIEGAASGVGLGHDFLRHVERTRVLIHLLDGSASEPLVDWAMINQELAMYDIAMEERPQLVVLNKMDLPDAVAWEPLIEEEIKKAGYPFMSISAATGQNVRQMLYRVRQMLDEAPPAKTRHDDEIAVIRAANDEGFTIEREGADWRVRGKQIERVAAMTYFEFDATLVRFQKILESMGISKALEEAGVQVGDIVHIGEEELEWGEWSTGPKIGLLGGTFDPPHWGHLWLAELAWQQLGLDKVLFLPVGQPPHKRNQEITAVSHRLQMVSLAIQNNPHFVLDTTDCDRPAPHSTVTLLPLLRQAHPNAHFWLLLGGDSLRDLPTWTDPAQLISQCRLAVLPRPEAMIDWEQLETAVPGIQTAVDLLSGPTLSLSATAIRTWLKEGHTAHYLLPTAVASYITQHQLYQTKND